MDEKEFAIQITRNHRNNVKNIMRVITNELNERVGNHDNSKIEEPELSMFIEFLSQIKNYKYGTKEYNDFIATNEYCKHHFDINNHHPEHFKNGVHGMNLADMVDVIVKNI